LAPAHGSPRSAPSRTSLPAASPNCPYVTRRHFDDPIPLPRGRQLVTLRDAAEFITELPNPVRVVAFNVTERWAEDASEDIAREIMRRFDLAGDELPTALEGFMERHIGPERQLTLRLA
jgi:hypothetical protein